MEFLEKTNYTVNHWENIQEIVLRFLLSYENLELDMDGGLSLADASYQLLKSINKIYGE